MSSGVLVCHLLLEEAVRRRGAPSEWMSLLQGQHAPATRSAARVHSGIDRTKGVRVPVWVRVVRGSTRDAPRGVSNLASMQFPSLWLNPRAAAVQCSPAQGGGGCLYDMAGAYGVQVNPPLCNQFQKSGCQIKGRRSGMVCSMAAAMGRGDRQSLASQRAGTAQGRKSNAARPVSSNTLLHRHGLRRGVAGPADLESPRL